MKLSSMPPRQLMLRGFACMLIGLAILVAPQLLSPASTLREAIGGSAWVGWLALVLGAGLLVAGWLRQGRRDS
ncbi:hypothetical protein [Xylophilus sp. ASV27]|uniref:hypothetical protein n=1 Tax=Xylophilus sp. ASV27 TaxID=2795129 RepID=UPI001E2F9233|nr:hypothetical protein [Xylophilus sp. ASV27]